MSYEEDIRGVRLCALCRSEPLEVGFDEDYHMMWHGYVAEYSFNGVSDGRYALVGEPDEFSSGRRDFGDIIENKQAPPSYFANVRDGRD